MGLLRSLLTLPVKGPIDGTLWLARKVEDAAQRERNDPVTLRRALQDLETQLLAGTITEEDYDAAETDILMRLRGPS